MKIIDFDKHYFEYAAKWIAAHPNLSEREIDESYNTIMAEWVDIPADWLGGATPATYFDAFTDPDELIDAACEYARNDIIIPEPLYSRIVSIGVPCEKRLASILADETQDEVLRAEVLGMLRDIGSRCIDDTLVHMVVTCEEANELCDMAADILSHRVTDVAESLLRAYPTASDCAKSMILDICSNIPCDERCYHYLVERLKNCPEQRAMCAALLERLGDERAIEPLTRMMNLFDLTYFDYLAMRNAVEALGGEVGEERTFYGDPDYEALRETEE